MARCVVVLADGLLPDAVTPSLAPSLSALARDYTTAQRAITVRPSVTVAALASLATGVAPATHGLVEPGLGFLGRLASVRPVARELVRHRIPTLVVSAALTGGARRVAWALAACAGVSRLVASRTGARAIARSALEQLSRFPDGLAVVYLPDCDRAGHTHGWMSPPYLYAVREVDTAVGLLADVAEDSLLVVVSDHGGGGVSPRDHDLPHPLNDEIAFVLAGPGVTRHHALARLVSILDVPPTVLHWFGVDVPESYEGRVITEAFQRRAVPAAVG
jgi:hypothetical protein